MDECAIPFPFGRTKAERPQGGRDGNSDQGTVTPTASRMPMRLTIQSLEGSSIQVEAFGTDRVLDLKLALQERLNFPADHMRLLLGSLQLRESSTLCENGITDGSVLGIFLIMRGGDDSYGKLVERPEYGNKVYNYVRQRDPRFVQGSELRIAPIQPVMTLAVKTLLGTCWLLDADDTDTIGYLKERLRDITCMPQDHFYVVNSSKGKLDQEDRTIGDIGLSNGEVLYLLCTVKGGYIAADNPKESIIELNINMDPEKSISVKAALGDSILSVKQSIEKETGFPVAQQTLRYQDGELEDDKIVQCYNVYPGCSVTLELK